MKPAGWFGIIVLFTVVTMLTVYFVPGDSPFFIFRYVFSFVFIMILPGYCLVTFVHGGNKLDLVEKAVLSVALSFGVTGIVGLFLGLSPIGLLFTPIRVSISAIAGFGGGCFCEEKHGNAEAPSANHRSRRVLDRVELDCCVIFFL